MNRFDLAREMEDALAEIPVIDIHTHFVGGKLAARGLHDIVLYHMVISDLYSAGCPSGRRLTEYPGWPTKEEAHARLAEAAPFFRHIRNTSTGGWGARMILEDLYGWKQPVTEDNWRKLDGLIRERADDRAWPRAVLDRLNIKRTGTEWARREGRVDDDRLQYALEWAFFTRCQWGEHDTALYELERCWGREPESPTPIGAGKRPATERVIRSLDDIHAAIAHYVGHIPWKDLTAVTTHLSTDIDYAPVSDDEMAAAIKRRDKAGPRERDLYASYVHEAYLQAIEQRPDRAVFQFSFGAEPLPHETSSRMYQRTLIQVADMLARHPQIHFQCMVASRHVNQTLCTFCRELPNLSLAGFWWHNFFPATIREVLSERLDMVAANKQVGFFSDGYCADWAYGKMRIARKQMAQVLADKIGQGQYTKADALAIARAILFESPQTLLGMAPRAEDGGGKAGGGKKKEKGDPNDQ